MKLDADVPWQKQAFGEQDELVRLGLGQALRNMHENARNAQEEARVKAKDPYGSSRYTGQFERIEDEVGGIPGARLVHPHGFRFNLIMVERGLIYPFRYAKKNTDVRLARIPHSKLIQELITNFGTESDSPDEMLDFGLPEPEPTVLELRSGLAGLPGDTMLILVPFACNAGSLLESYWGVASLSENGADLQWASRPESLPVPDKATVKTSLIAIPDQSAPKIELSAFNHGAPPQVSLVSRAGSDVKRKTTPKSEVEPIKPQANENDD
ncbi:hypothetical protein [Kitasatospora sp. NBC_01302]|uniref:hypothetical protein n=1 Tax=Kitasatospora sp. NBC_01302 TaxID=2903575 RepID=UPI002E117313|nr:hypothetical protein OG294_20090 [Kitasatospora sp. NBC_01302]